MDSSQVSDLLGVLEASEKLLLRIAAALERLATSSERLEVFADKIDTSLDNLDTWVEAISDKVDDVVGGGPDRGNYIRTRSTE